MTPPQARRRAGLHLTMCLSMALLAGCDHLALVHLTRVSAITFPEDARVLHSDDDRRTTLTLFATLPPAQAQAMAEELKAKRMTPSSPDDKTLRAALKRLKPAYRELPRDEPLSVWAGVGDCARWTYVLAPKRGALWAALWYGESSGRCPKS